MYVMVNNLLTHGSCQYNFEYNPAKINSMIQLFKIC